VYVIVHAAFMRIKLIMMMMRMKMMMMTMMIGKKIYEKNNAFGR